MKLLFLLVVFVGCCSAITPQSRRDAATIFEHISENSGMLAGTTGDATRPTLQLLVSRSLLLWLPIFQHIQVLFNESNAMEAFYIKLYLVLDFRHVAQYLAIHMNNASNEQIDSIEFNDRLDKWQAFLVRFIKLLNILRQINGPANDGNEMTNKKNEAFLLALEVREDFRKIIIGEPDAVGRIWSGESTIAMTSHKNQLEKQKSLLNALEKQEPMLAKLFIDITDTTMDIVGQMQICNEILAVKRDSILNDFNFIIFGMDMESIIRRVVTANQLFCDNSDNENLVYYKTQLESIDTTIISSALKAIGHTKVKIDVFINKMKPENTAKEIQWEMDMMNEVAKIKRIQIAYEAVFKTVANILFKHKDKDAVGKEIPMYPVPMRGMQVPLLNDYQYVNYIDYLIEEGQLFSPIKIDKENVSTQYIHGLLRAVWQYQRSRYIELQTKIPKGGPIAAFFAQHLKYFLINESLVGPSLGKIYSMRRTMPKEAYTDVIEACADFANSIEKNLSDLEGQIAPQAPLQEREDNMNLIFNQIYNQLEEAVVVQWKNLNIFSSLILRDLFNYSRNGLGNNIYSLTLQNMVQGNHHNNFEFVSVILNIAHMSMRLIDNIFLQNDFSAEDVSTIYRLSFTMLAKEFYVISSVVGFITEGRNKWDADIFASLATKHQARLEAVFNNVSNYAMSNSVCGNGIEHGEYDKYSFCFTNWNAYASPISAAMLTLYSDIDTYHAIEHTELAVEYNRFTEFLLSENGLTTAV